MKRIKQLRFFMVAVMLAFAGLNLQAQSIPAEMADSLVSDFGINLLESEIDAVLFQTNEFLTDATFIGASGPFWWLSEIPNFGGSNLTENQLLRDLSHETNGLGGTKTGQNRKKTYPIICLSHPTFQTSRLQVQSYENVPKPTRKFKKIYDLFGYLG